METMLLSDYSENNAFSNDDNDNNDREYNFNNVLGDDVEIASEVYDIVIVDNWQTEQQEIEDMNDEGKVWCGDGELLAEIYVDQAEESTTCRDHQTATTTTASINTQTDPDDCINLSWLLNFKLDDIINCQEVSSTSSEKKTKRDDLKLGKSSSKLSSPAEPQVISESKPPYTYTKLIELALREKGELTVSGIYQWISQRFPFFKPYDDRWKNSVRHNLSISPHFRKGAKASRGAGHLWTVATPSDLDRQLAAHRKPEMEPTMEQELEAAAASILPDDTDFISPVAVEEVNVYDLFSGPLSYTY